MSKYSITQKNCPQDIWDDERKYIKHNLKLLIIATKLHHFHWLLFKLTVRCVSGMMTHFYEWEPTESDVQLLKNNPKRKKITEHTTIGTYFF